MQLIEVNNRATAKQFLEVARIIYKDDPFWVCPLDITINQVFDPQKNVFFSHGEATRWILKSDNGELIGRVAAFINTKKAYTFQQPTGGMGFFECINDREAAFLLFDTCRDWLAQRGMEAMDGPINFGENDNFWGLLVEGFMHPGFGMNYNPPYYKDLFEAYGFNFYFEQVSNHLDFRKQFPERFWKIAEWVMSHKEFSFEHFTFENAAKYIRDLKAIYDEAWQFHENFTPINEADLLHSLEKARAVIETELIWFVYTEGKPIAFLVMIPDANQILRHLNGKLHLWNKLKFMWLKKRNTITRARIVIMGVVPKYQKYGIESGIFWQLDKQMKKRPHYSEIELSWVGDFNPKMRKLHESVGATFAKRHITYRKIFSENTSFTRSTIIPVDTKEKLARKATGGEEQKAGE